MARYSILANLLMFIVSFSFVDAVKIKKKIKITQINTRIFSLSFFNKKMSDTSQDVLVEKICSYMPYFIGLVIVAKFIFNKITNKPPRNYKPEYKCPPKLEKQDLNLLQLSKYDGRDENKPNILVAVNHRIYDVSKRSDIYGPGGGYNLIAGRDASRALATMKMDKGGGLGNTFILPINFEKKPS